MPALSTSHLQETPERRGQPWNTTTVFYGWTLVVDGVDKKSRQHLEILGPARPGLLAQPDPFGRMTLRSDPQGYELYLRTSEMQSVPAGQTIKFIAEREGINCIGLMRELSFLAMGGPEEVKLARLPRTASPRRDCLLPDPWSKAGFSLGVPRWHAKEYQASINLRWEGREVGVVDWSETEATTVRSNTSIYNTNPHRCFLSEALKVIIEELARQTLPELSMGELEASLSSEVEESRRQRLERAHRRGTVATVAPAATNPKIFTTRLSQAVRLGDDQAAVALVSQYPGVKQEIWYGVLPAVFSAGMVQTARALGSRIRYMMHDDLALCRAALEQRHPELLAVAVALEHPHRESQSYRERARAFFDALAASNDPTLIVNDSLAHASRVLEALPSGRDVPHLFGNQDTLHPNQFERLIWAIPQAEGKVPTEALLDYSAKFKEHDIRMASLSVDAARLYVIGGNMKVRSLLTALFRAGASWKEVPADTFASWQDLLVNKAGEKAEQNLERLREHLRRIGAAAAASRLQGLSRVRAQRDARALRKRRW